VRGEGADGAGHRRRARAHSLTAREAGKLVLSIDNSGSVQEAEGGHVPILRAQAVRRVMQCNGWMAGTRYGGAD
jgi:hypothetical protein